MFIVSSTDEKLKSTCFCVFTVSVVLVSTEFCTASVSGEHEYEVQVRFKNGLAFIADQNGVRQVDAARTLP